MEYNRASIEQIVKRIVYAVNRGNYKIEQNENRQKNVEFIAQYGISKKQIESILTTLKVEDYSEYVQNVKPGFEDEKLHIFGPVVKLISEGEEIEKDVTIYLKTNIIERAIDDFAVIVSFHEAQQKIKYAFI